MRNARLQQSRNVFLMREFSMIDRLRLTALTGIGFLALAGCGGSKPAPATSDAPPQTGSTTVAQPVATTTTQAAKEPEVDPKRKETKWIGSVPYDVFYDRPWEIAADRSVLPGTQATSLTPDPGGAKVAEGNMPAPADATPAAAGSDVDWAALIPIEILNTEVKVTRSKLQTNLQSLKNYNAEVKSIATDGAYLAALAATAERHSGEVSWKANAKFVRDLAFKVYESAQGNGRTAFEATQLPFEQLCTVLDGGPPPEMESQEKVSFGDVAYLNELMKWLEPTFNSLKANVNTEARMKEDPETLERQLRSLALVGRIMGDGSYASAEEPKYQGFVNDFVGGSEEALAAAKLGNFDGFQSSLNRVQTSCSECHPVYRGNGSGF